MSNVALIILFNHNYEKNLDLLRDIYGARFSSIWYIIPFYSGDREDVITVYENSYYFQGYIATALTQLKPKGYEHYFIIGDDLYLNPEINETNYKEFFKVDDDTAFIPGPFLLTDVEEKRPSRPYAPVWGGLINALNFKIKQYGIQSSSLLPTVQEAASLLKNHGFNFTPKVSRRMFFSNPIIKVNGNLKQWKENLRRLKLFYDNFWNLISPKEIPYPLIGSYSDIIIISSKHQSKFTNYCGAFAALNLYVEIALPSALVFAYPKIISENDLDFKGETYWYYNHTECEKKYNQSLSYLKANFPEKCLYVHPIKLSKWK
jgi:hypothetical protein